MEIIARTPDGKTFFYIRFAEGTAETPTTEEIRTALVKGIAKKMTELNTEAAAY